MGLSRRQFALEVKLAALQRLKRVCQLGQVSREGFYCSCRATPEEDPDVELWDAIQPVALAQFEGYWSTLKSKRTCICTALPGAG